MVTISKTADAPSVSAGSQIGFTVTLNNTGAGTATGLSVSDNLPAGTDVNWTIDAGNTSAGWSVSGSPPNQSLLYSPTTLAGNTSTTAHVVSTTTTNSCGTYSNTASFTTSNDGSGSASDSEAVICPVQLASVVSRLNHTGVGDFDITMPLSGTRGVECRASASLGAGNYTIVFSFSNTLSSVGGASPSESGCGTIGVGTTMISGSDYIVNLTGVCNAQYATVTLTNVNDSAGHHSDNVASPQMGFLIGDTSADGVVNAADITQTRRQSGNVVAPDGSNFREDVTVDGVINSADITAVRRQSGNALPTPP